MSSALSVSAVSTGVLISQNVCFFHLKEHIVVMMPAAGKHISKASGDTWWWKEIYFDYFLCE